MVANILLHRQPVNPTSGSIPHAVAADAGVVPVGDEDGAIGGDADIAGAEPIICACYQIDFVEFVACAFGADAEEADFTRAGVGVKEVAFIRLGFPARRYPPLTFNPSPSRERKR